MNNSRMNNSRRNTRVCQNPYRKWTETEQRKLLRFLKENQPIERPTAQAYYRNFSKVTNVNAEWNLVRSKVKNMRLTYKKVATQCYPRLRNGEITKKDVLKKCPLFDEYVRAFGSEGYAIQTKLDDTDTCENSMQDQSDPLYDCSQDDFSQEENSVDNEMEKPSINNSIKKYEIPNNGELDGEEDDVAEDAYERVYEMDSVTKMEDELMAMKKELNEKELLLQKAELELKKLRMLFEKEKYEITAEQRDRDIELQHRMKDREMEMQHQLKVMEMEMKKEVALREIEMREKIEIEKLKLEHRNT